MRENLTQFQGKTSRSKNRMATTLKAYKTPATAKNANNAKVFDFSELQVDCKVVIIGYGLGGREVSKNLLKVKLEKKLDITVVEANAFYESDITIPFALSDSSMQKYFSNFSCPGVNIQVDGNVTYEQGKVSSVEKKGDAFVVNVETPVDCDNKVITADIVVCATGFSTGLIKPAIGVEWKERISQIVNAKEQIAIADNIIVAGGGPVGVDVCGAIRSMQKKPSARITHIISGDRFLSRNHSAAERKIVTDRIRKCEDVDIIVDYVINPPAFSSAKKQTYKLKSGKKIVGDVFISSFAVWDRCGFLQSIEGALAENGQVDVDEHLMCRKVPNLFAVGCSNNGEMASIPKIAAQSSSVSRNIANLINGKPLVPHKEGMPSYKAEGIILHGDWAMASLDELDPFTRTCCFMLGFPFPCCLAPCLPFPCALCGYSCSRLVNC